MNRPADQEESSVDFVKNFSNFFLDFSGRMENSLIRKEGYAKQTRISVLV